MLNKTFIQLSHELGGNHLLVQGAGGNTSYKNGNKMWIKASGKWLANATHENIFVLVDLDRIRDNIIKNRASLDQVVVEDTKLRPSIETTLHALMPHKVVLHTHPVELLSWIVRKDGKEELSKRLENIRWAWVPYARPGIDLTQTVQKAIGSREVDVLVLGNHGLVVGGKDCETAHKLMDEVLNSLNSMVREVAVNDEQLAESLTALPVMRLPKYNFIHSLALDRLSYKYCCQNNGLLYPDQAVFLGAKMHCYEALKNIGSAATFTIIQEKGVFISKNAGQDVDEMLRCHAEILMRINDDVKLRYLTESEVEQLLDWEPEKYRQMVNR